MVSAEPHIYITAPSARLWIKNNRGIAASACAVVVVLVLVAVGLSMFLMS